MPRLPPGLYDALVDDALAAQISETRDAADVVHTDPVGASESPRYLADHVRALLFNILREIRGDDADARRVALANTVLSALATSAAEKAVRDVVADGRTSIPAPAELLAEVAARHALADVPRTARPENGLSQSTILTNASGEPSLGSELRHELKSANGVDLLCAFVMWSGFRLVRDELARAVQRGARVRVITTTYLGASERRAIDALVALGAEVRVSFDTRRTRLHAKAWLFTRKSGAHTAYIGSSNLSKAAMVDGLEWNVRLSQRDAGEMLDKFRGTFDSYWEADEFVAYDPVRDRDRLDHALRAEATSGEVPAALLRFDLQPHEYQKQILEALRVERVRGHARNLVVAPTGTGKTLVAAFDYERLRRELPRARLLFVAHRERILDQSRGAFRQVLRDGSFGEMYVAGARPERGDHVFASIQSLARVDLSAVDPSYFDVVVVDEFHHAEAPSYQKLLEHLRPRVLLGMTATPERHDGGDVRRWFDGRIAYEMRLWHALEQGLLAPFHYFAVKDVVDVDHITWKRTGYDRAELEKVYTGNDRRVSLVLAQLRDRVSDPERMRALGFCVGVEHARFMAARFTEAGLKSRAVLGDTLAEERDEAIRLLENGELRALFTVDLFNEGVDIPSVDTVLFLRPTESATVFLQQLGRGLRLHGQKSCLTVLDFIGNARREFRFDRRYRALLGGSTSSVVRQIENGFPYLPPGCAMKLDDDSHRIVLENIRRGVGGGKKWLSEELRSLAATHGETISLATFLAEADVDPIDLYANKRSFTSLKADVFGTPALDDEGRRLHARLGALLHVNDDERLRVFRDFTTRTSAPRVADLGARDMRLLHMLVTAFFDREPVAQLDDQLQRLWDRATLRHELSELLFVADDRRRDETCAWQDPKRLRPAPLHAHARYRQEEVLAALNVVPKGVLLRLQAGVCYVPEENVDLLFVTLNKSETGFSPSTRYRDYALSPTRLHWESQNTAHAESETGRRYIAGTSTVLLFVREEQKQANGLADPYVFLGPVRLVSWSGDRPMQIVWELGQAMPPWLYQRGTLAAG